MVLEFYYDLLSQPCRAVYLFLKAAGIKFEPKVIDLMKGENYNPEFLKKNPFHKVPLIDDGGFILAESVTIMRYIAIQYKLPEHWYPRADVRAQARVDEFLNWQHLCVRKPCMELYHSVFQGSIGIGRFTKQPLVQEKVHRAREEIAKCVTHIANHYLNGKPFIAGDYISAADVLGVCELAQIAAVGEEASYANNRIVVAWMERVKSKLQPHYDECMRKLDGFKKMNEDANAEMAWVVSQIAARSGEGPNSTRGDRGILHQSGCRYDK
ncbi:glutathione S-transferase theta-1-like [Dreissena polymorpha]|uniref:GST N-terminal domain-containing protein n=1 Tax=Dreissena polymorpha TaxID=45954 RepID=A0A9D4L4N0_DREPO|nr:glutathione S-transferase theta-1-like [Dreissena polymorpha]XP_052275398.1 glutathione S-transferase theta-1-like [Dreissena polymorpha]KAH3851693.1 hypothetical protein DPMN_094177 [Dreissena polymorpha]